MSDMDKLKNNLRATFGWDAVTDHSDEHMKRLRVSLAPELACSIVEDPIRPTGNGGFYLEVAVFNGKGEFITDDVLDSGDDVIPYLTYGDVWIILNKLVTFAKKVGETAMSLDFELYGTADLGGKEPYCFSIYEDNITHNLSTMAEEAGIYKCLWRPDENGYETAGQLVEPLKEGISKLKSDPDFYKMLNPENGWDTYEGLVDFAEEVLEIAEKWPKALILVSR